MKKKTDRIPIPHPGETIREDYLKPLGMSVNKLAIELRVPATRMTEIVNGRRGIRRHRAPFGALLQHHRKILAKPSGLLRFGQSRRGGIRSPAPGAGGI